MFGLRVLRPRLGAKCVSVFFFSFFFFLLSAIKADFFNRKQCICALFTDPQISLFINFFIKNGFHGTIHIFKNYFVTVFFSFQFSAVSKRPLCQRIKMSNDIFAFMIVIFFQNFLNIMTEQDKCHHMFLWFSCPNQDLSYQNDF